MARNGLSAINPTCPSGQGNVYHYNESGGTRQNVAIKKYLIIEGGKDEKLVESEIITMAKCGQHRNILRLHSIYIYDGCVFLVTPYCNGGTLQQYCIDNWVILSQMVFILKRLLSGLVEIHKHGYIHRDIKCENFFLGEDNTILKRKIIEQGRPHYPRNMNDLLMDFVDRCLKPDYSQRASASELLEEQFNT
ncbi:kinase-like domain-containing protein [Jimgerdemannia flammicorona]|uniref:Kinase-like domain-containing protein n=1 Tax=Jimgerdemannia flammicorona TaxID=994334 RepID=A0A433QVJ2_9FUNG|nr:kinase-like domain-containing protein [Jimgerdemannia flammicorona]